MLMILAQTTGFRLTDYLPSLWVIALVVAAAVIACIAFFGKIPLQYNLRNLTVRWLTTLLTVSVFALFTGLLVAMLAFVNGMYRLTESSGQPGNVIILSEGAVDEAFSNFAYADLSDIENQPGVERDGDKPLASRETYLVVNQPVLDPQPGRPKKRFLQLRGIDEPVMAGRVHGLGLKAGSEWFSAAGVRSVPGEGGRPESLIEAVLGEGVAGELGRDRNPAAIAAANDPQTLVPGDTFLLGNRRFVVAGIMNSNGSTFDSEVWAKQSLVGKMFGKEAFSTLVCRAADAAGAQKLKNFLNNDYKKASVRAQVETEYFASLSETNKQFLFAIIFVAVIMSVGGVFGVMNTMFAAIAQRTKDIGVLRIIGYKRAQILTSFLLESLLLAVIGGAVGCALGSLAHGWRTNSVVGGGQGGGKFVVLEMVVDGETLAVGMVVALMMGLVGGVVPAIAATFKRPLESLR